MTGRWPANVVLSPSMAEALDEQSGDLKSPKTYTRSVDAMANVYGAGKGEYAAGKVVGGYNDDGGASKFFLQAGYESWELEWILSNGLRPCGI